MVVSQLSLDLSDLTCGRLPITGLYKNLALSTRTRKGKSM